MLKVHNKSIDIILKSTQKLLSYNKGAQKSIDVILKSALLEIVKCGFWRKLSLLPLLWCANAVDENE